MKRLLQLSIALLIIVLTFSSALGATTLMPVACDGTHATNELNEGDDFCVYGTGFEPNTSVDVYVVDHSADLTATNAIASTSAKTNKQGVFSLQNIWENVKSGIYNFFADLNGNGSYDETDLKNPTDGKLIVTGNESTQQLQLGDDTTQEVPEFGTITAALMLVIAGYYIQKKRKN